MRVPQFLLDSRVAFETVYHPPAYTAQRRAKVLHVSGRRLVKTVLLHGPRGFFVAVLPASARVNLALLAEALGGPVVLAGADDVPEFFRDCEWGALTPFGSLYGLTTVLEASLSPEAEIVFEGHSHAEAIRMRCREYEALERPLRLHFTEQRIHNTAKPEIRNPKSETN